MKRREFLKVVPQLGLVSGLAPLRTNVLADERKQTVRGRVIGDGKPLVGVLVSNGRRVVQTDSSGEYALSVGQESGRFIFVTTPRGYWIDEFYVPISTAVRSGQASFSLRRIDQPDRFAFVFMADMHLGRREPSISKLKASISEMNDLKPKPAFLLAQGDICLQAGVGDKYAECLKLAKMPVRNGAGNHEMMLRHEDPRDDFERFFGPSYYSFDWGPIHCVVLDGNKPIPHQEGWKAVHGAVEGNELAWLAADLAAQPKGKPIVVGVHIPIVSSYPERRNHNPKDAPYWEMTNSKVLTDLFARHGVRLVLQGHMHENERTTVEAVEYVSSISISGSWWKSGAGFERGVDNCPRGYRIISVDGQKVTHRYQSTAESQVDRRGEFYGLDHPLVASDETEFVFNCYDAPHGSVANARIDDGPWQHMPDYAAPSPATAGLTMTHHFRLLADTTELAAGPHSIDVRVTWPDGTVVEETGRFVSQAAD